MSDDTKPTEAEDLAKRLADAESARVELEKRATAAEQQAAEAMQIAKAERDQRLTAEYIRKAEGYAHLPLKADVLGPLLKKLADTLTADEYGQVEQVLTAANAAAGTAFVEHGRAGGDAGDSATERLDRMAKGLVAEGKVENYAAAIGAITKNSEHAELLKAYRAEQLRRN